MNGKKWIKTWFIIIISIIPIVGGLNYIIDPRQIFHSQERYYVGPSSIYELKVEYIDENHKKYNSYLMGSSRIGTTDPSIFNYYMNDTSFYNFYLASAKVSDLYKHLKYMLNNDYEVKNVIIQIDIENMYTIKEAGEGRKHPNVDGESYFKYILSRLFNKDFKSMYKKITAYSNSNRSLHQVDILSGTFNYINRDRWIKEDHSKYILEEKKFHKKHGVVRTKIFWTKSKYENILIELKKLLKEYRVNYKIIIPPQHHSRYDVIRIDDYIDFLMVTSKHFDYYNFSGYNLITTNNYNYYESSHYLPNVGKLVAAKIFNDKKLMITEDFGFYVTKENFKQYSKELKNKMEQINLK